MRSLLDTSVVIGQPLDITAGEVAISAMTLAELHVGVLFVRDAALRAARLRRLATIEREFRTLPIDAEVARRFGEIVADARRDGRRPPTADALIAATAIAHDLELITSDRDFESFGGLNLRLVP